MEKLYYFAHPYEEDPEKNFKLANTRTVKLLDAGYLVFSPITHTHYLQGVKQNNHDFWLHLDFTIMDRCDVVIFAPEWEHSKGCVLEMKRAIQRKQQILFYPDFLNNITPKGTQR